MTSAKLSLLCLTVATLHTAVLIGGKPVEHSKMYYERTDYDTGLYDPNLFEGDIEITQEMIEHYYGAAYNSLPGKVCVSI